MMYSSLNGKSVVITGGASGIGLTTALRFASEGAAVTIIDLDEEKLAEAKAKHSTIQHFIQSDVGDYKQLENAFEQIDQHIGKVDVLIANAGISVRNVFASISVEQWNKVINTNLNGIFYSSKLAVQRMLSHKEGVILVTGSTNGKNGYPFYADYNASKAGVILLAKTMAKELAPHIRVNAICPGYVMTPMQMAEYDAEMLDEVNKKIPIGRHAKPEEIANLFAFLASSEAAYITGHCYVIDGGETA